MVLARVLGGSSAWSKATGLVRRAERAERAEPPAGRRDTLATAQPVGVPGFPAASALLHPATLDPADEFSAFNKFAALQVEHQQPVRAVFLQLTKALNGPGKPKTVAELYQLARTLAAPQVAKTGTDAKLHARKVNLVAVVAVAAHALGAAGGDPMRLPGYIPDDRDGGLEMDRTWHVATQCMFSYLWLYDHFHGDGSLQSSMDAVVEAVDPEHLAAKVELAYEKVRGLPSSLLPGTLGGPPSYDGVWAYVPRPSDFTCEAEAKAYDQSVRVGSAYEVKGTPKPVDLDRLGDHSDLLDPIARIDSTLHVFSGLGDGYVTGDLSANRVGARLGVMLFREPGSVPALPYDDGPSWKGRAWAERKTVPFDAYYADESLLLARLGGFEGSGRGSLNLEDHAQWARGVGRDAARQELVAKIEAQVDRLSAQDPDKLARFYATFAVRQLRWRVPFSSEGMMHPSWEAHYQYAKQVPQQTIASELKARVQEIAARSS